MPFETLLKTEENLILLATMSKLVYEDRLYTHTVATNLKPQIQPITMSYDYQLLHKAVAHVKRLTSSLHTTLLSEIVEVESHIRDTRPQGSLMGCKFLIPALNWTGKTGFQ